MGCEISQRLVSFDQVLCIANEPVEKVTNAEAPWPELIHAHSSPFSCPVNEEPVLLTHPPAGFWSVRVSAYSWPPTMEKPSSELLTKFAPQLAPRSATYGMLVKAISPYGEGAAPPPLSVVSPL